MMKILFEIDNNKLIFYNHYFFISKIINQLFMFQKILNSSIVAIIMDISVIK